MSDDMPPDAVVLHVLSQDDLVSSPDSDMKMFVLVPLGPLFEVYGWESDVAAMAACTPDSIYFWAEDRSSGSAGEQPGTGVETRTPGWTLADCGHLECVDSCQ